MCAAARSTPWPDRRDLPVLDRDDLGTEPTVRAEFSFGQVTLPMQPRAPGKPIRALSIVKPVPRVPTPTPRPNTEVIPTPLTAPPPSPARGIAIGFTIGTTLGLAILGAAWHFFL